MAQVPHSPPVNRDYSLLSRMLFVLLLSLAGVLTGQIFYRAKSLAQSLRESSEPTWAVTIPIAVALVFIVSVFIVGVLRKNRLRQEYVEAVHLQNQVRMLALDIGIGAPDVRVSAAEKDARVEFLAKSPYLVAPPLMERLARIYPESIRPVLVHELAHIANGDARPGQVAEVVLQASLLAAAFVVTAEFLAKANGLSNFVQSYGMHRVGLYEAALILDPIAWVIPFAVALLLSYAAFFRMREFEADRVVAQRGLGDAMATYLLQATNPVRSWLWLHPTPAQRAKSLREHATIHNIEHQTIGLVSAVFSLIMFGTFYALEGLLAKITVSLALVMGVLALSILGICFGRRTTLDGGNGRAKATAFGKSLVALVSGVTSVTLCVNLTLYFVAGVPVYLQVWEAMIESLSGAAGMSSVFFLGFLVGAATANSLLPTGIVRHLWLLIAMVPGALGYMLLDTLVPLLLDPYGISLEAKFWIVAKQFQETVSNLYPDFPIPPLRRWKIGPEGIALTCITFVVSVHVFLFVALAAIRALAIRLSPTALQRHLVQAALWGAVTVAVFIPTALTTDLAFVIGKELRMNPSMWISCSTSDAGGLPDETPKAAQFAEAFAREVITWIDNNVNSVQTAAPGAFVGMREDGCNTHMMAQYPAPRALLARIGIAEDIFVNIAFSDGSLHLETQHGTRGETEPIPLISDSSVEAVSRAIAYKHFPYHMARREVLEAGITDQRMMLPLLDHADLQQRAWAHNSYGNLYMGSNAVLSEQHLKKALELQPNVAVFHANYAYLLILNNRCDEAAPHVLFAASKGALSSLLALGYGRCLRNKARNDDALTAVWKLKRLFVNDALFEAALGEMALFANQQPLARWRIANAMELSKDKSAPACARLFSALFRDITVCDVQRCAPPLSERVMTTDEKYCWAAYAQRYGHRFEVTSK